MIVKQNKITKEDILNLGWRLFDVEGANHSFNYKETGEFLLYFGLHDNPQAILITKFQPINLPDILYTYNTIFLGKLKNKSELKKLMEQIEIA